MRNTSTISYYNRKLNRNELPVAKYLPVKVQIHDEIFSCNFGLMIQKLHEQLNFIVETLVRDMKH
jgi:hypothetical protein